MKQRSKKQSVEEREAKWWRRNFPTVKARDAADKAFDALPVSASEAQEVDTWIAAYKAAGGVRPVFDD